MKLSEIDIKKCNIGDKLEFEDTPISNLLGNNQEVVGIAIAVRGDNAQQILWFKNNYFMED